MSLLFSYNDEDYPPMSEGGHGVYRYHVTKSDAFVVSSVLGEQDVLPQSIDSVTKHLSTDWSGTKGVFLPPCSGGLAHHYTVKIDAVDANDKVLASKTLLMGRY